jgi:hypothetical protein
MWVACAATTTVNSSERDSADGSARVGARADAAVLVPVLAVVAVLVVVMEEATATMAIASLIVATSCLGW